MTLDVRTLQIKFSELRAPLLLACKKATCSSDWSPCASLSQDHARKPADGTIKRGGLAGAGVHCGWLPLPVPGSPPLRELRRLSGALPLSSQPLLAPRELLPPGLGCTLNSLGQHPSAIPHLGYHTWRLKVCKQRSFLPVPAHGLSHTRGPSPAPSTHLHPSSGAHPA